MELLEKYSNSLADTMNNNNSSHFKHMDVIAKHNETLNNQYRHMDDIEKHNESINIRNRADRFDYRAEYLSKDDGDRPRTNETNRSDQNRDRLTYENPFLRPDRDSVANSRSSTNLRSSSSFLIEDILFRNKSGVSGSLGRPALDERNSQVGFLNRYFTL